MNSEHIKCDSRYKVISYISRILSLCIRFVNVPYLFTKWLLIPKNYRPVFVSTTFAKLLKVHILHECREHEFHDLQFGFIKSRGTTMTVGLGHDVTDYYIYNGSRVYVCSLDAEGAFDSIPHSILFKTDIDVISPKYWRILLYWYSYSVVHFKWDNILSDMIHI